MPSETTPATVAELLADVHREIRPCTSMTAAAFSGWIDTFVSEKGLSTEHVFTVHTDDFWGTHYVPLAVVIEAAKGASPAEQVQIKKTLVMLDFKNGDVMHYFEHLAKGLALMSTSE